LIWIKLSTNFLNTRDDQGNGFWKSCGWNYDVATKG